MMIVHVCKRQLTYYLFVHKLLSSKNYTTMVSWMYLRATCKQFLHIRSPQKKLQRLENAEKNRYFKVFIKYSYLCLFFPQRAKKLVICEMNKRFKLHCEISEWKEKKSHNSINFVFLWYNYFWKHRKFFVDLGKFLKIFLIKCFFII